MYYDMYICSETWQIWSQTLFSHSLVSTQLRPAGFCPSGQKHWGPPHVILASIWFVWELENIWTFYNLQRWWQFSFWQDSSSTQNGPSSELSLRKKRYRAGRYTFRIQLCHVVFVRSSQNLVVHLCWILWLVGSYWVILDMVVDGEWVITCSQCCRCSGGLLEGILFHDPWSMNHDDDYMQSMLPLQWRFVGRQVRSLQGVEPAGQVELVRHRLEIEY